MSASFDSDFIEDPELKMSDAQIGAKANELFEKVAWDHGHAGYSGTFAEKTDKGIAIYRGIVFETADEAYNYVQDVLDNDKWGPADVIPVEGKGWFIGGWCSS